MRRCDWTNSNALETEYHDKEWGIPVHDDRTLFEMLILESAQSGLSWATILKKHKGYLSAFDNLLMENRLLSMVKNYKSLGQDNKYEDML